MSASSAITCELLSPSSSLSPSGVRRKSSSVCSAAVRLALAGVRAARRRRCPPARFRRRAGSPPSDSDSRIAEPPISSGMSSSASPLSDGIDQVDAAVAAVERDVAAAGLGQHEVVVVVGGQLQVGRRARSTLLLLGLRGVSKLLGHGVGAFVLAGQLDVLERQVAVALLRRLLAAGAPAAVATSLVGVRMRLDSAARSISSSSSFSKALVWPASFSSSSSTPEPATPADSTSEAPREPAARRCRRRRRRSPAPGRRPWIPARSCR